MVNAFATIQGRAIPQIIQAGKPKIVSVEGAEPSVGG